MNTQYYKEMTLRDLQRVSLDIMKHLHDFCIKNKINYSLGYGTLIGAIRHKGFIPWDDDLDVVMLRDDFNKLCQQYKDNPDYKLFTPQRHNTYAACARLCEMNRTYVQTGSPLFTEPTGVWIDIFPLDIVGHDGDDMSTFLKKRKEIIQLSHKILMCRSSMLKYSEREHSLRSIVVWLVKKVIYRQDIFGMVQKHCYMCENFVERGDMIGNLSLPYYNEFYHKSIFNSYEQVDFEDTKFMIASGFDELLRSIYGDYMILPSKEKQVRGHSVHKYYWK